MKNLNACQCEPNHLQRAQNFTFFTPLESFFRLALPRYSVHRRASPAVDLPSATPDNLNPGYSTGGPVRISLLMPPQDLAITSDTSAIERAARAMVYITVEWSVPERLARPIVRAAIGLLPDLGFEFFAVEEDGPVTGPWLISHGWTRYPRGCGSLLWFENGKPVARELLAGKLGVEAIVRKTLALWGKPAA